MIVILTLILILIFIFTQTKYNNKEGFNSLGYYGYRNLCGNCGNLSRLGCYSCSNCGVCVTYDNKGLNYECLPGNEFGPYFRKDCLDWSYHLPYRYHTYNNPYRRWHWFPRRFLRQQRRQRRNRKNKKKDKST